MSGLDKIRRQIWESKSSNRLPIDILKEVVQAKTRRLSACWAFEIRSDDETMVLKRP